LASCLFFRFDAKEVARTLKTDAILITANTGSEHLIELRNHLYNDVKIDKPEARISNENRLEHLKTVHLKHSITLNSSLEIEQLLTMTPHYWRATQAKKQALFSLNHLQVGLDIEFNIYRRTSAI
jgi:23S rRNA (guanine745-N1)-methyltransferase